MVGKPIIIISVRKQNMAGPYEIGTRVGACRSCFAQGMEEAEQRIENCEVAEAEQWLHGVVG